MRIAIRPRVHAHVSCSQVCDAVGRGAAGEPEAVAAVAEQLPISIYAMDGSDLRFVVTNAAYRLAVKDENLLDVPMREAYGLDGQETFEAIERVYTSEEPLMGEEWRLLLRPEDPESEVIFTFSMLPWQHADGSLRGVVGYVHDMTEAVLAREGAERHASGVASRLEAAQATILDLQRNLLPKALPVLPGLHLTAQYVVAGEELQAGGDWFDAVPLADGRVALVVGDVVGHGAAAAAAMAQLRPVLREALLFAGSATEAVDRLDAFAAYSPATRAATVCVAVIDPVTGAAEVGRRGHPAPLGVGPDGSTRLMTGAGVGPLGVSSGPSVCDLDELAHGAVLLLYSDGLIERPGRSLGDGIAQLAKSAGTAMTTLGRTVPRDPDERVSSLTAEWLARAGYVDDVTILAAHRLTEPVVSFDERAFATHDELVRVRDGLTSWLEALGAGPEDVLAVALAAWEAIDNVAEHAYVGQARGELSVVAELDATGSVEVVVADQGCWRAPEGQVTGGRGLTLMRVVTDAVDIDRGSAGTRVRLRRRLGRPVTTGAPAPVGSTPVPHLPFGVVVTRVDPTKLSIRGPVDASSVELLRAALVRDAHAGEPLALDLSRVTFLASSGVQLLHELAAEHGDQLELIATPGSPAAFVLDLVGLGGLTSATVA